MYVCVCTYYICDACHAPCLFCLGGSPQNYLTLKHKRVQVGFTVEGRDDAELPEVMLGVAQFNRIDVKRAFELALPANNTA